MIKITLPVWLSICRVHSPTTGERKQGLDLWCGNFFKLVIRLFLRFKRFSNVLAQKIEKKSYTAVCKKYLVTRFSLNQVQLFVKVGKFTKCIIANWQSIKISPPYKCNVHVLVSTKPKSNFVYLIVGLRIFKHGM